MKRGLILVVLCVAFACVSQGQCAEELKAFPVNATTFCVQKGDAAYVEFSFTSWGAGWKWMGLKGKLKTEAGKATSVITGKVPRSGANLTIDVSAAKSGPGKLTLDTGIRTDKDAQLTYAVMVMKLANESFSKGKIIADCAEGKKETKLPLGREGIGTKVSKCTLVDNDGKTSVLTFSPPVDIACDRAARIILAQGAFKAAEPRKLSLSAEFNGNLSFLASPAAIPGTNEAQDWFTFKPDSDHETPSEIGMQDWLEKPAGKHGRILRKNDKLIYNNKEIKLWGLNLCYATCAPDKALADKRARFYEKFGINSVRLHKYADGRGWAGIQAKDSFVKLDPAGLDRMDYMIAKFKERGIYVKLSAHFGTQNLGTADKQYVPYLEEFGKWKGRKGEQRIRTPASAVHYSPELQKVQIEHTLELLKHKNPHTGMTYAEDPAIAFIEILNEQSILFYSSMAPMKSPTLRKYVGKRFCDWLRKKYTSHEKLKEAWGEKAMNMRHNGLGNKDEHLDKNNVLPLGNPWFWDPAQLAGSQAFRKKRLLDSMSFLYELQNECYDRFVKALREGGFKGEIIASNWQAGRAYSHYLNLHSDARIGTIDRHNYFGGGGGGTIKANSMLSLPGSGSLSSGMQQVSNLPFMLSEWIHVNPCEWGMEGPAIIGAYGMGLQGWDVSYMFQNRDQGTFSGQIGKEKWDVAAPQVMGVFPAVARQVLRSDVKESKLVAPRFVHVPSLYDGKLGFEDKVTQAHDVKTFDSAGVTARTLAVARCVIEFTDAYKKTPAFDLTPYEKDGFWVSSTGQLKWKPGKKRADGYFTMDTPGTKAVVGFAKGTSTTLGPVTIKPQSRFAGIYVTAKESDKTIETSKNLLVVAIARARNTGAKVLNDTRILNRGKPPVVLEPVKAEIAIKKAGKATVVVLDHCGKRTKATVAADGGTFTIDGAKTKACYYLVTYE